MSLHRLKSLLLVLLLGLLLVAPAPSVIAQSENEVAIQLRAASERLRAMWASRSDVNDPWWDLEWYPERVDASVSAAYEAATRSIFSDIRSALRDGSPRFAVQYEQGLDMSSDHMSVVRRLAVSMRTDIFRRMSSGDMSGIADDIMLIEQLGHGLQGEQTLTSSLYSTAIGTLVNSLVESAIGYGAISQADAKELADAMSVRMGDDPYGYSAAIFNEAQFNTEWMLGLTADEAGLAQLAEKFGTWKMEAGDPMAASDFAVMTGEEMNFAIAQYQTAMEQISTAMQLPTLDMVKIELERLDDAIADGIYGPITAVTMSYANGLGETLAQSIEQYSTTEAMLLEIANDPNAGNRMLNAAIWYRKAAARMSRVPAELLTEVSEWEPTPGDKPSTPLLSTSIDALEPIIESLRTAASIKACHFTPLSQRPHTGIWPWIDYLDPLKPCVNLMLIQIKAGMSTGEADAVIESVAILVAMIDHLADDARFAASELSLEIAADLFTVLGQTEVTPGPGDPRPLLDEVMLRVDGDDPFGFVRAMQSRATVVRTLARGTPAPKRLKARLASHAGGAVYNEPAIGENLMAQLLTEAQALDPPDAHERVTTLIEWVGTCINSIASCPDMDRVEDMWLDELELIGVVLPDLTAWAEATTRAAPEAARKHLSGLGLWVIMQERIDRLRSSK